MQLNCTRICRALLLGLCIAISATPAQAQRRGGGSHSSRSYSSRSYTPRASRPRSYAPRAARPRSYSPKIRAPRSSVPRAYSPRHSATPRSSAPIVRAPRHANPSHARAPRLPKLYTPKVAPKTRAPRAAPALPGTRDSRGRIKRSAEAKEQFMKQTGHPHGWPGHVVDHVNPLACGGADAPSNMQWQTTEAAKAKDKVERIGCGRHR